MPDLKRTKLYRWLKHKDSDLANRISLVRDEVSKWLSHITQFFPHYPNHAEDHSDRIASQLSQLLFDSDKTSPKVKFSAVEVYCLLAAVYLHDMGMVVSPLEAELILISPEWKKFIETEGPGHESYNSYIALRDGPVFGTDDRTQFLAGQSLKHIIADFIRREHHERVKSSLELHKFLQQLVDFGDPVAFETISNICIGHGLAESDLSDEKRFPEERDVLEDKVNVRFLARLLRIGDLLDMSSKRADPLTARALGPLPTSAKPHWQQYSAKTHENITPRSIEFVFECSSQDAHRVLRDWFGWLENEVRAAGLAQLHSARHDNWKAPKCVVSSQTTAEGKPSTPRATIRIQPKANANYSFHDWKLEIDHDLIIQRLVRDVYKSPVEFLRELLQNALDATRCQMYSDYQGNQGNEHPDIPSRFPLDLREKYAILVTKKIENIQISPDGPMESRVVITIEDRGVGMNEDIIRRYFLQVGRSYYQSNEFRQRFKFAATSRFGVGFLSVFAVSKDITVDTARLDDISGKVSGIRLKLREPRNYLLTEPWEPFLERSNGSKTGTRIRIVIDQWPSEITLTKVVREWCVAVEVPIRVIDDDRETIIRSNKLVDGTVVAAGQRDPNARFLLRVFDLDYPGVEGQIAVVTYNDEQGEAWCDRWPRENDLGGRRIENLPKLNLNYTAFHGVRFGHAAVQAYLWDSAQWIQRCDVRSPAATVALARSDTADPLYGRSSGAREYAATAIQETAMKVVDAHLRSSTRARGREGFSYRADVLTGAPVPTDWRDRYPRTVVTWQNKNRTELSFSELLMLNDVTIPAWSETHPTDDKPEPYFQPQNLSWDSPIVNIADLPQFGGERFKSKVWGMNLVEVNRENNLWLLRFKSDESNSLFYKAHKNSRSDGTTRT